MTIIIDGNNLLFRASFSVPEYQNSEGLNIAAVHQTLKIIRSYAVSYNTKKIITTWDQKLDYNEDVPSFRQDLNEDYKQNRTKNNSVYKTTPAIIEMLQCMGIPNIFPLRMEADDVISWLAQNVEGPITIITGDKDMLQLINSKVSVYNPYQKKTYTEENFEAEMGLPVSSFVLYKCIMGDASDNVKGIERFGDKKSKKLALQLKTFDNISSLPEEHQVIIRRNQKIMDLTKGWSECPEETKSYEDQFKEFKSVKIDPLKLKTLATKLEMHKFADNLSYWTDPFQNSLNDLVLSWLET